MAYGFALQPYMMGMDQLKNQVAETLMDQGVQAENSNSQAPANGNKLKKKKKLNNGEAAETGANIGSPKLKKSKSESIVNLTVLIL